MNTPYLLFLFLLLQTFTFTSSFELKVDKIDVRDCPFITTSSVEPSPNGAGVVLTHSTTSKSFASIGPNISPANNKGLCYLIVEFTVTPNARLLLNSVNLEADVKLDDGVTATYQSWFTFDMHGNMASLPHTPAPITGPKSGKVNITMNDRDHPDRLQSSCQHPGLMSDDHKTTPLRWRMYIRTAFFLSSSGSGSGVVAENGELKQTILLDLEEPCEWARPEDTIDMEWCDIDREGVHVCKCQGKKFIASEITGETKCEKWKRFPPDNWQF